MLSPLCQWIPPVYAVPCLRVKCILSSVSIGWAEPFLLLSEYEYQHELQKTIIQCSSYEIGHVTEMNTLVANCPFWFPSIHTVTEHKWNRLRNAPIYGPSIFFSFIPTIGAGVMWMADGVCRPPPFSEPVCRGMRFCRLAMFALSKINNDGTKETTKQMSETLYHFNSCVLGVWITCTIIKCVFIS